MNSALAEVIPAVRRLRIPVTRDQAMLLLIAVNLFFLGGETYLAHSISGTIVPREWIPILFGPLSGALLLVAGLVARRRRMTANLIATLVFAASAVVGILGTVYHWARWVLPNAAAGERFQVLLILYAPPLLAPATFALVGLMGLSAAWHERPVDSGQLILPGGLWLHMPYSKSQAYFLLVAAGTLITLISSVVDHALTHFENPWVWVPVVTGVFATAVFFALGFTAHPGRADLTTYTAAAALLLLTGAAGFGLHVWRNTYGLGGFVIERFIRGAPAFAPLLFANMGLFALIVLLEPEPDAIPPAG